MSSDPRRVAVVTGTRAEYGLLRPVIRAIANHPGLTLEVLVTGTHLLPQEQTIGEIAAEFPIAATVPMQSAGRSGRPADAQAMGRGVSGFAELFGHNPPDVVLVLGDRIEAFAAAAAASVAGVRVAHIHGGDRAEGIADEALRHAITKLAHIHLAATQTSAQRIIALGEEPDRVHVVGSPAMDDMHAIAPLSDDEYEALGGPQIVMLLHPSGGDVPAEYGRAIELLRIAQQTAPTVALHPNHDAAREGIVRAIRESSDHRVGHLPREKFIGLLRRARLIVGNSSAGLIEGSAIPIRCINIGSRQAGREMPGNVVDIPQWDYETIHSTVRECMNGATLSVGDVKHPYGDGQSGPRIAALLADCDPAAYPLRKRNTY